MIKLFLLGTLGCHLCETAEAVIELVSKNNQMTVEAIDIAEQEQWQDKYAVLIPVIYHPETKKELGWPFTEDQVQVFINELK